MICYDLYDAFERDPSTFVIVFFGVLFGLCAIVWILYAIVFGTQHIQDSTKPVRKEDAKVVLKEPNGIYILFELCENGERIRLQVKHLNKLVEGDIGVLTWQGSRVINFERKIS